MQALPRGTPTTIGWMNRGDGRASPLLRQRSGRGLGAHRQAFRRLRRGRCWRTLYSFTQVATMRAAGRGARRKQGEIAASLAPDSLTAKITLIEIAIAHYRFVEAQQMMAALLVLYPENQAVQRLARDLDAKRRWLFEVEVQSGNSDGGGANALGRTFEGNARLYSPPIADNWRARDRSCRLFECKSAGRFRRALAHRRRPGMAKARSHGLGLSDLAVGARSREIRRRRGARLGSDRRNRKSVRARRGFPRDAAACVVLRDHRRHLFRARSLPLARIAQPDGLLPPTNPSLTAIEG